MWGLDFAASHGISADSSLTPLDHVSTTVALQEHIGECAQTKCGKGSDAESRLFK